MSYQYTNTNQNRKQKCKTQLYWLLDKAQKKMATQLYEFDIEKISSYLLPHTDKVESYCWKPTFDYNAVSKKLGANIQFSGSQFDKELVFRTEVSKIATALHASNATHELQELALWIVSHWGGIRGLKDMASTLHTVNRFLEGNYTNTFLSVASVSKIASFLSPTTHIIYDARIAYTMNWILLSQDAGNTFFPANKGRNSRMNAFDLDTLIRLKYANRYNADSKISTSDKTLFVNKDAAYPTMNALIRELHARLYPQHKAMPFVTEMLLFCLADTQVYSEICKKTRLAIY